MVRYADDFVILARSRRIIELYIKPAVLEFLRPRGLELSEEKTKIFPMKNNELHFLGYVFKHRENWKNKYQIIHEGPGIHSGIALYPSSKKVKGLLNKVKETLLNNQNASAFELIAVLNPILRGWYNYFNLGNSSNYRRKVGHAIYQKLMR